MSKDNRRGLFETLFLRVMIVISVALSLMIGFSHLYQIRYMNAAWRADLQQEAVWTARHFGMGVPPTDDTTAPTTAHGLGEAWRSMHENVRLIVRNGSGEIIMDSHPEQGESGGALARTSLLRASCPPRIFTRERTCRCSPPWCAPPLRRLRLRPSPRPTMIRSRRWGSISARW